MSAGTFTWNRAASSAALDELVDSGALSLGLVLTSSGDRGAPVTVRPPIADLSDDWVASIEAEAGLKAGASIAVVGDDADDTAGVAAELAVRLGDSGKSVVLIDGHLEAPSIAKALAEDGDEGLVDCVLFGVSPSLAARRTLAPGVRLMTAGSYPLSVQEVLGSDEFSRLLTTLSEGAVVVLALPGAHLKFARPLFTSIVAVGGDPQGLGSLAALAGEVGASSVVGILIGVPRPAAPAAAHVTTEPAESERPAAVESARRDTEGDVPVEPAAVGSAQRDTEGDVPVEPAAVESAQRDTEGGAPVEPAKPQVPWAREERPGGHPVITAALLREPLRRRSRAPAVVIAVLAVASVATWIGLRGLPGRGTRPGLESERVSLYEPVEPGAGTEDTERADESDEGPGAPGTATGARAPGGGRTDAEAAAQAQREEPGRTPDAGIGDVESADRERVPAGPLAGPGGRYTVFVSSHRIPSAARTESDELGRVGVSATIIEAEVGETGTWYRVAVSGGYPTLADARVALHALTGMGYEGAWIERSEESH